MNSIEGTEEASPVDAFFEQHLLPLAAANCESGREYFPEVPDPSADSYYQPRIKMTMSREDFELPKLEDTEELHTALGKLWHGDDELQQLAGPVAELATKLREVEDQDDEVSPFIYVMF